MDTLDSTEMRAFRREVRDFVTANLPKPLEQRCRQGFHPSKEDMREWTAILHGKGWSAPHWPTRYGGTGWSPLKRMVFDIELAEAWAPAPSPFGLHLIGPVIYTFGTDQQKERYLPRILDGSEFWCQGYSEPNAGSDLASLRTAAKREGDYYRVNGQKIWTSQAQFADWIFCLVRTDNSGKKQNGISMLLIDMHSPGVTVKPIITQDMDHYVNEVFFEDVRVPAENLIGEENAGWRYAKFLLENERTSSAYLPQAKQDMKRLREILDRMREQQTDGIDDEALDAECAALEIEVAAHELAIYRILTDNASSQADTAASMVKIQGARLQQRISALWVEVLGMHGLPLFQPHREHDFGDPAAMGAMSQFLIRRAVSIYGGTNEIQHGIIAKRGLHL